MGEALALVGWLGTGVLGLVWGPLFSGTVIVALLLKRFLVILPPRLSWKILKDSMKVSYPLTPLALLGVLRTQFDKYMIALLNTTGGVGIYSVAQRITHVIFMYMTAIQNVFQPQVYKQMFDSGEAAGKSIGKYLTPKLFISYIQEIFSPNAGASLEYSVTDNLKIKALSGKEQSMDILYQFQK